MSRTPAAPNPPTSGFTLIEGLLHEYRDKGRIPTLDKWIGPAKERLTQFKAQNSAPQAQKEAQTVEEALNLAVELIQQTVKDSQDQKLKKSR